MATALSLFVALLRHPGHHTHCALEGERETKGKLFRCQDCFCVLLGGGYIEGALIFTVHQKETFAAGVF